MTVNRKDNRKQNPKRKRIFSIENHFHKNLSQRSYQWGTREGYLKKKVNSKNFNEKHFSKKTFRKIGSMIVHGKDIKKQNLK